MKTIKNLMIAVLFVLISYHQAFSLIHIGSDSLDSFQKDIEKASATANLKMLKVCYENLNQLIQTEPNNSMLLYYRSLAEYRFLSFSFSSQNNDIFDTYYDTAKTHIEKIIDIPGFESEGKTLMAGIYMIRLAIKKMEGPILSMKIGGLIDEALKSNPNNPRALYIQAVMKAQTPAFFGGDKKEAVKMFRKSIMLFEKNLDKPGISWGYLETLAWLGQTLKDLGEYEDAEFTYNKGLDYEPDYGWIKYSLLPQLQKERNKKNGEKK
jgi:tetratricopeptide (TPR) repeat protein